MSRFSEINRTYNVKVDDLKRIMIDTFVADEGIDIEQHEVTLSFTLGTVGSGGYRDDGWTDVTGATFTVKKRGILVK